MSVKDKVVSDWWYNLPNAEKDQHMDGKIWPATIPARIALMREFYDKR